MNVSVSSEPTARAWYQHRMMLLVVGIPLTSVIVSFAFLATAIRTFDGVVVDDYYKQGKEINRLIQRDEMAQVLGLQATITLSAGIASVVVSAAEDISWPDRLSLGILHPTQDGRDIRVDLQPAPSGGGKFKQHGAITQQRYQSAVSEFKPGDWILQLGTPTWRLTHRSSLTPEVSVLVKP